MTASCSSRPTDGKQQKRLPAGPTPFMLMQDRAERGEMDAAERKEYIEMLKDLKEIKSLMYQLDHVEQDETSSAQKVVRREFNSRPLRVAPPGA